MVDDTGKEVLQVITDYAYALNLLDRYDHGTLAIEETSGSADFVLNYESARRRRKDTIMKVIVNLLNRCN